MPNENAGRVWYTEPMSHARTLTDYWMTADQFMDWPGDGTGRRYQLVDGEPQAMAPPSKMHGLVQANLVYELTRLLRDKKSNCRAVIGPGVQPRPDMAHNVRVPDVAVECAPGSSRYVDEPVLICEVLSPSNARETREAVRACLSIPSLREVLILGSESIIAELLRRAPNGDWPKEPTLIRPGQTIPLESLGIELSIDALYEGLGLT